MKKSLFILFFVAAFASANAQISWGVTNHSSYQCGYRDGYHIISLLPGMSSLGYDATATLPTQWSAQYTGNPSGACGVSGTHKEPVGPTSVKMLCPDAQVYVQYSVGYDAGSNSYFISVDFYDK